MYGFVHFCVFFSTCITLKGVVVILLCFIIKIICFFGEKNTIAAQCLTLLHLMNYPH